MPTSPGRAARARQVRPRGRRHVALLGALAAHVLARRVLAGHVLAGVALVGGLGCGAGVIGDPPTLGGGRPTSRPRPTGSPVPSPTPTPSPTPSPTPTPTPTPPRPGTLDVTLTVKETAGVGALGYPVSAVVPLPYGMHQDTSAFRVAREDGTSVPAQFEVLNRHWGKDRSLRHVVVHFQADVGAFGAANTGVARYHFRDDGTAVAPPIPVRVEDGADAIVVDTGKIQLRIGKRPFSIGTPAGPLEATFLDARGGRQRSFAREDVVVTVEESGPLRAVIRAEALSRWSDTDPTHGWAIRLYAYADQSFVKVDYQLQNGATNVTFAGPLYFEGLELSLATGQAATPASVRAGPVSTDPGTLPLGALDAGPVRAMIRNFHQSWPNGLALDADGTLRAELWPTWSAQDYRGQVSGTGLYWLNDMQAVVKEVLLDFGTSRSLDEQARLFQLHPVTTVPTAWYASTRVTLDLGGAFPVAARIGSGDRRRPDYQSYNQNADVQRGWREKFGWNAFGADLSRRDAPSTTGGWPYSVSAAFLTEDPADYWFAEDFAMGELNVMPEWLPGYTHAQDYARLQLSENPYGTYSWRRFDGVYGYAEIPGHRPGTGQIARPRDDQHSWVYHVEEAYYLTGNLWIRDWYRFIAQFRRVRLLNLDPYPDLSGRALGHSIGQALQAYRVLGDAEIPGLIRTFMREHVIPDLDPVGGGRRPFLSAGSTYEEEAIFQLGYLARALIDYLEELPQPDMELEAVVGGFVRWNVERANFAYYLRYDGANARSDPTGLTFCDAQAWWALRTGDEATYQHLRAYITTGIGGGQRPYGGLPGWSGDFNGRVVKQLFDAGGPP